MKRKWKRASLIVALALLALGAGSQLLLSHLLHGTWLPRKVQEKLSDVLEAPVRVHRLGGSIWGSIRAEGLEIDSPQTDTGRFLEMDRALIDFSWWRLLRGDLGSVTLVQPRLTIARNPEGEWNLPPRFLKKDEGAASQGISLPEVGIQQGHATLIIPGATLELDDIRLSLRHLPPSKGVLRYRANLEARIPSLKAPLIARGEIEQENAQFRADGSLAVSDISLPELNALLNRYLPFPFSIASGKAEIRSSFQYAQDEIQCSMEMDLADMDLQSATRSLELDTAHVTGKCQVSKDRSVRIEQARIDIPALGQIDLRGTIPSDNAKPFSLRTEWKSAPLDRMAGSLRDWISHPVTPEGTLDLTIDATGTVSSEAAFNLRSEWKDFQLTGNQGALFPVIPSIQVAGRGIILPGTHTIEIPQLEIASENLFSASANIIVVSATEGIGISGWSSAFIPDISSALSLSERYLPPGQIKSVSGQIRFEIPFQLSGPAFEASPTFRLQITEAQSAWGSLRGLNLRAQGTLQNRAWLTGQIEAELDTFTSNSSDPYQAEGLTFEQTFQSQGPLGYVGDMNLKIQKASIPASTAFQIPLQDISVQAHLNSSPTLKEWSLDAERIAAKGLPNCSLSAALNLDENPSASVRFHTETLDAAALYSAWESSLPVSWQGWTVEGQGSFGLSVDWHGQQAESAFASSTTGEIAGLNFFSADASKAGSNLNANLSLSVATALPEPFPLQRISLSRLKDLKNVDWKAQIGFQGDEFLLGTLYQEIKGIDIAIASQGRYFPDSDRIDSSSAIITLHPLGGFAISGSASNLSSTPEADVAIQASRLNLEELHGRFIRDGALKDYLPSLSGLAPTGIVDASVAFEGDRADWRTQGLLELDRCDLQWPSSFPVDASGIELRMPFRLASRKDRSESSQEDFPAAHLKYQGIAAGPLVFGPAEISFILADNDFRISRPVSLSLAGGNLSIHELEIEDILAAQPHVVVHADATGIRMESVTRNLALGAVPGILSADLPRLETLEGDIISDGPATLKVFDGEVQISGIQIADYASSGRKIQFSADLKDINLLPLTSVLQYGQASGIIQGSIRDFSWGPGGLESFDVSLESVSRRGVPQEISVDLIEVITESGRGLGPAERAILRRSDLYKYNRLGLAAQLKDDRLTIRGTIPRKEAPLFMEGSSFGGINIALYPPPHGIAFEQYIEYLKRRIKQIKSSGGPKIE